MPQFAPGDLKTAIAPIAVKPTGLSAQAELFLGPNDTTKVATSGLKAFTSTGAQQNISLPVTMPTSPGTYHVYLDVYAGGAPLAGFVADEDVVIMEPEVTAYALSVINAPAQVVAGQNFAVLVHLEIPQSELYPPPREGGEVSRATFAIHTRLKGPAQGAAQVKGDLPVGANDIEMAGLTTTDWWYGAPLPKGVYDLQMRLIKTWTEYVPQVATYSFSEAPLGDYKRYATIEIV